jgi:NAD(P)-dependent dehydrogenase (short-subunit alcohol dehydrogenase family)
MRIVLVGASGTIGQAVAAALGDRHDIVKVGSKSGDVRMDIADRASIRAGFAQIGHCDAVIVTAGRVKFAPLGDLDHEGFMLGLRDKLMGQVDMVLLGRDHVADGGSFTLTSGLLSHDPIRAGASASMVNAAVDAFVLAAAIELPRGQRINAVSPALLDESVSKYGAFFPGHETVPAARVAQAYVKSVEGALTGRVFRVL